MLHDLGKDVMTFRHRALPRDGEAARCARILARVGIETATNSMFSFIVQYITVYRPTNVGTLVPKNNDFIRLRKSPARAGPSCPFHNGDFARPTYSAAVRWSKVGLRASRKKPGVCVRASKPRHFPPVTVARLAAGSGGAGRLDGHNAHWPRSLTGLVRTMPP